MKTDKQKNKTYERMRMTRPLDKEDYKRRYKPYYPPSDLYDYDYMIWEYNTKWYKPDLKMNCPDIKGMTTESAQAKKIEQLTDVITQQQLWLATYAKKIVEVEQANKNLSDWNNRLWNKSRSYNELYEKHDKARKYVAKLKKQHEKEITTIKMKHTLQRIKNKHALDLDIDYAMKVLFPDEVATLHTEIRSKLYPERNYSIFRAYEKIKVIYHTPTSYASNEEKYDWKTGEKENDL